jgi:hypothetical protein
LDPAGRPVVRGLRVYELLLQLREALRGKRLLQELPQKQLIRIDRLRRGAVVGLARDGIVSGHAGKEEQELGFLERTIGNSGGVERRLRGSS